MLEGKDLVVQGVPKFVWLLHRDVQPSTNLAARAACSCKSCIGGVCRACTKFGTPGELLDDRFFAVFAIAAPAAATDLTSYPYNLNSRLVGVIATDGELKQGT